MAAIIEIYRTRLIVFISSFSIFFFFRFSGKFHPMLLIGAICSIRYLEYRVCFERICVEKLTTGNIYSKRWRKLEQFIFAINILLNCLQFDPSDFCLKIFCLDRIFCIPPFAFQRHRESSDVEMLISSPIILFSYVDSRSEFEGDTLGRRQRIESVQNHRFR